MGNVDRVVVTEAVIETLRGLFADNVQLGLNTNPIKDLGLESVDGILLAPRVSRKLGIEIPHEENLLVDSQRKSRTVQEIVDVLLGLPLAQKENTFG